MIKIIDGVKCDTRTAGFVGMREIGAQGFGVWKLEELFKSRSGRYFLYRLYSDESQPETEEIELLSDDSALEWAREHMPHDEFVREFEVERSVDLRAQISEESARLLAREREVSGESLGEVIDRIVKNALK